MKAEIISIGTELLLGHIVNTNAAYLSRRLAELGIDLYFQTTVGDNPQRLTQTIRKALVRSDVVILTGGLGPTIDDITSESVANLISKPLVFDASVWRDIQKRFGSMGVKMPSGNKRQAMVPKGAICLRNNFGTAPALIVEYMDKVIICLPGPPREMEPLFEDQVASYLKKRFKSESIIVARTIKIVGLPESFVNNIVRDLLKMPPPTTVGIYAKLREVHLVIMAKARSPRQCRRAISPIEKEIVSRLRNNIFGYDGDTLESIVGMMLLKKKLTISVAESCTGGLLSKRFTDVNGSSRYFMTGIVTYSNESKSSFLGVKRADIVRFGAVSNEVASQMASGIKYFACTDIGIGITGVAGPAGGSLRKPIGLVYIAIKTSKKCIAKEFRFSGSREDVRHQASQAALDMVRVNI